MGTLRILLAFAVLIAHCGSFQILPADLAVEAFYIISGFYMTMILNEKYVGKNSYWIFIKKRFFRLAPTYWIIALLTLIFTVCINRLLLTDSHQELNKFIFNTDNIASNTSISTWLYTVVSNIFMLGQDIALFLGVNPHSGNLYWATQSFGEQYPFCRYFLIPQAWSIGLEFTFYLIAPFVVRKKNNTVFIIFLLSLGIKIFLKAILHLDNGNWNFRFFPSELMFFCLGYFGYKLYKKSQAKLKIKNKLLLLSTLSIFVIFFWQIAIPTTIKHLIFIIIITFSIPVLFSNFKSDKRDRIIGELSYPIYICHALVISIFSLFPSPYLHSTLIILIVSTTLSVILYFYLIKPLEKIRNK